MEQALLCFFTFSVRPSYLHVLGEGLQCSGGLAVVPARSLVLLLLELQSP